MGSGFRTEIIRGLTGRGVCTTTIRVPKTFIPIVKALLTHRAVVLDSERERITKHSVALSERHAMLLDVCRILLRVEIDGHKTNICILCIYVNADAHCG